ncbi:dihydrodipicolinate synthase family protein [Halobacteriales archaeon QS_8_69_26]|nr:MAG: dihydrodipicolinate synthase family protein [Halobacteriales archaeon QS_8_69_26]
MDGTGVALVTPFGPDGSLREDDLRSVADRVAEHVDFVVPCGSTGEAPLLTDEEAARVVRAVADEVDVPVVAGTGGPGFDGTLDRTVRAAEAGADAALVVTPYYYGHDQRTLSAYYRDLADESPLPVYLYSIPTYTGVALSPETVGALSTHPNVAGIKDSSGDLERAHRYVERTTDADFSVLVGSGSIYAAALDGGADGAILAMANLVPGLASEVYRRHREDPAAARALNADLVELNHAVTARYGVPGLKAAMEHRGMPAGHPRRPFRPVGDDVRRELATMVDGVLDRD